MDVHEDPDAGAAILDLALRSRAPSPGSIPGSESLNRAGHWTMAYVFKTTELTCRVLASVCMCRALRSSCALAVFPGQRESTRLRGERVLREFRSMPNIVPICQYILGTVRARAGLVRCGRSPPLTESLFLEPAAPPRQDHRQHGPVPCRPVAARVRHPRMVAPVRGRPGRDSRLCHRRLPAGPNTVRVLRTLCAYLAPSLTRNASNCKCAGWLTAGCPRR